MPWDQKVRCEKVECSSLVRFPEHFGEPDQNGTRVRKSVRGWTK